MLSGEIQDSLQRSWNLVLLSLVCVHCHGVDTEHIGDLANLLIIKLFTLFSLIFLLLADVLWDALLTEWLLQEANNRLREVLLTEIPGKLGGLHLLRVDHLLRIGYGHITTIIVVVCLSSAYILLLISLIRIVTTCRLLLLLWLKLCSLYLIILHGWSRRFRSVTTAIGS